MSSLRQILSARANGARSRGPVTAEGKARSSQNAVRHGLLAKCLVLSNEFPEGFREMHDQLVDRFRPTSGVEDGLLEEMLSASWRIRRSWAIETRIIDDAIAQQPPGDQIGRLTAAFRSVASGPELPLIHRYETRLHSMYQRALHNLLLLRATESPNEPDSAPPDPAGIRLLPAAEFPNEPDSAPPTSALQPPDPNGSLQPPAPELPNEPDSAPPASALQPPDPAGLRLLPAPALPNEPDSAPPALARHSPGPRALRTDSPPSGLETGDTLPRLPSSHGRRGGPRLRVRHTGLRSICERRVSQTPRVGKGAAGELRKLAPAPLPPLGQLWNVALRRLHCPVRRRQRRKPGPASLAGSRVGVHQRSIHAFHSPRR